MPVMSTVTGPAQPGMAGLNVNVPPAGVTMAPVASKVTASVLTGAPPSRATSADHASAPVLVKV